MIPEDEIEITIEIEPEHIPFKGNCRVSGDPVFDKSCEDWIQSQLEKGNEWAWCCVRVVGKWNDLVADDYLGCCSYESEKDFRQPGGYFEGMRLNVIEDLNKKVRKIIETAQAYEKRLV